MNYSYSTAAAESTASLPRSNVPTHCLSCAQSDPAIWKYFMNVHFDENHNLGSYQARAFLEALQLSKDLK